MLKPSVVVALPKPELIHTQNNDVPINCLLQSNR